MSKHQVKIINVETGEEIVRDATDAEIQQIELDAVAEKLNKASEIEKAATKSALLERLGITTDEAALLLS